MTRIEPDARLPMIALCLLLAASAVLRARELTWGMEGHPAFAISQHSDETRKLGYTLELKPTFEGLRPNDWLLYKGTLLPTLGRLSYAVARHPPLQRALEWLYGEPLDAARGQYLFFRSISGLAALALVALTYLLARRLSGSAWTGILAAGLLTTSFGVAYTGATYKSDMLLTALMAALFVATVGYVRSPTLSRALAMGVALGVAGAAKHSAVIGSVLPALACAVAPGLALRSRLGHLSAATLATLAALGLSAPYYVLELGRLQEAIAVSVRYQAAGEPAFEGFGPQPATVIGHLLGFGLGPLATALGLLGFAWGARRAWRGGERAYLPLLGYAAAYFAVLSNNTWIVLRYTLPLYALLCSFGAILLHDLLRAGSRRGLLAARGLLALVVAGHAVWFLAFDRMLSEPTPPAQASAWLKANLPRDAAVLEIRRRPPIVYGYSAKPAEPLRAMQVDAAVERGERLSSSSCDYVVVTDESFRHYFRLRDPRFAAHRAFFAELFDVRRFREVARFETDTRILGIQLPRPFLPEDVVLVSPVTYVFERVRAGGPGARARAPEGAGTGFVAWATPQLPSRGAVDSGRR